MLCPVPDPVHRVENVLGAVQDGGERVPYFVADHVDEPLLLGLALLNFLGDLPLGKLGGLFLGDVGDSVDGAAGAGEAEEGALVEAHRAEG